ALCSHRRPGPRPVARHRAGRRAGRGPRPPPRPAQSHQHALVNLDQLATEQTNPRTADIDRLDTLGVLERINAEDQLVAGAVRAALPDLARAVDLALLRWQHGGRIVLYWTG